MHTRRTLRLTSLLLAFTLPTLLRAQSQAPTTAAQAPNRDSSYIDAQGTAHVTRVVPVPATLSPEAQRSLSLSVPDQVPPESLADRRSRFDENEVRRRVGWNKIWPNQIVEVKLAGVPVRIVTPDNMPESNRDKVLLNLHGGGFSADWGSYSESIPIAGYAGIKVAAVLYRLIPEYPFPAALDDAVAVYEELLKTYTPEHIVVYGTSAGAILTAELAVKLKQLGIAMPAALGIFSGTGDMARAGDSASLFSFQGLSGHLDPPGPGPHAPVNWAARQLELYAGGADLKDPALSPIYADLRGLPPTLFVTSERDWLLSGTANLHLAYLHAGVDARLVVFDALPHGFWNNPQLPESIEANQIMADFFVKHLAK